jgi:endo-1,4-beta-D-glucanase Y
MVAGTSLAAPWAGCTTSQDLGAQSCRGAPGGEYCACRPDGSCNLGYVCATDLRICVHLAGTPPPPPSTGGSTGVGSGGNSPTGGTHVTGSGGSQLSGGGGGAGSSLSRGPTPPMNGTNFPFPQNRESSSCVYPTAYDNDDVMAAYTKWKADLITSNGAGGFRRVQRTSSDPLGNGGATPLNSTVSEGIGYGLIIAVYMGDQALFDDLWKYEQLHLDSNGLMNGSVDAMGNTTMANGQTVGQGAATDADEDMAWALVMADKQWGGQGSLSKSYSAYALQQIQNIWNHEVTDSKLAGPGDGWPGSAWDNINISYFAPAYYRAFKRVDPTHDWDAVSQTVYDTMLGPSDDFSKALSAANKNITNGLVPAWCNSNGGGSGAGPFYYQYDSCRTPFRIGMDWCLNGSMTTSNAAIDPARAKHYVSLTSSFFSGVGAANLVDGYNMDGTVNSSAHQVSQGQSAAFMGPAAVGAMSSAQYQSFLNDAYKLVKGNNLYIGGQYYDECWTVMSLLMMTGNFLDYTQLTPAK